MYKKVRGYIEKENAAYKVRANKHCKHLEFSPEV